MTNPITPDARVVASKDRKPWNRPSFQRLGAHAAGAYKGGTGDGLPCPGADKGHRCS